jgi:3-hydroxyisobutyrate dehydrogenase-like beta-hydroxyacid dehydrogenase
MIHSQTQKPHIGFIGMGSMGSLMTMRLLQSGYPLSVYDRTQEKAQEAAQNGATLADTPRDLALASDFVLSSLTDYHALHELMYGEHGAIAGAKPGSVFVDLSTIAPSQSRQLAADVKEQGAQMIDAAVSGSTPQAKGGELVIFVGGEQEIYSKAKTILEHLGKSVFYMGQHGMGTTMKMVVNTLLGLGLQAVAEAVALGEKAGLEKNMLLDVLGQTAVIAPTHKSKLDNLKNGEYPTTFSLALMRKDFSLIMREAAELSVSMPATAAAEQMYAAALARGLDADYSIMLQFMREMAGIEENR